MSESSDDIVDIADDLIINNVERIKESLIRYLNENDNLEVGFSKLEKIDVSGLQLLISFIKEVKASNKEIVCSGEFKESFTDDLNRIAFAPGILTNGQELNRFIEDTI